MQQSQTYLRLKDRVALVTGGGSGIGRAAALAYAHEGAKVVVAGRRKSEIKKTVSQIASNGGEALAVVTDVSIASDVKALINTAVDRYGRLDVAFNNAGVEGFKPITAMTEAEFDQVIDINLKGVWLSIKYEVEAMLALGNGGAIVNTSSWLAKGASVGSAAYSASKGALDSMIRAIALEVGPQNIRVNNVNPGIIFTPMTQRLGAENKEALESFMEFTPTRRVGTPEDVGDVAVWLSTDEARFVTGETILVDGGYTIAGMR